jgi:hypothetical protein
MKNENKYGLQSTSTTAFARPVDLVNQTRLVPQYFRELKCSKNMVANPESDIGLHMAKIEGLVGESLKKLKLHVQSTSNQTGAPDSNLQV